MATLANHFWRKPLGIFPHTSCLIYSYMTWISSCHLANRKTCHMLGQHFPNLARLASYPFFKIGQQLSHIYTTGDSWFPHGSTSDTDKSKGGLVTHLLNPKWSVVPSPHGMPHKSTIDWTAEGLKKLYTLKHLLKTDGDFILGLQTSSETVFGVRGWGPNTFSEGVWSWWGFESHVGWFCCLESWIYPNNGSDQATKTDVKLTKTMNNLEIWTETWWQYCRCLNSRYRTSVKSVKAFGFGNIIAIYGLMTSSWVPVFFFQVNRL